MGKKAVLFDLDNTLYDYDTPHKKSLKEVHKILRKYINISSRKFMQLYDISRAEIHRELSGTASAHNRILYFQRLIEKTHNTVEPGIILHLYNTYWNSLLSNMKLKKEVLNLLKTLKKQDVKIAIVTDLTTQIQLRKIKKLKIGNYIDVFVTSEEAGSEKPHQIMFLLALNKLGLQPKEVMMVGDDSVADVEGANAVGIDTVLLKKNNSGKKHIEDYKKPDYTIKGITEILKILNMDTD